MFAKVLDLKSVGYIETLERQRMLSSGMLRHVDLVGTDVAPKWRFLQRPRSLIPQKTAFFTVTAVKTSNLT
jgi:hypothetical protein